MSDISELIPKDYIPEGFKPEKLDINNLLTKALNNDNNETIMKLDKATISKYKNDILQKLQLGRDELKKLTKKLKEYRYISDISELNYGSFIRYINLGNTDNIKLTNGGVMLDIKFYNSGIILQCKNFMNRLFTVRFDECLIFQKITNEEKVLLDVIDYIK